MVAEEAAQCRMGAYVPAGAAFGWDPPNVIFEGTEEQIQKYAVPTIEHGEKTFVAISEPAGGADPARAIATTAKRDGDNYILNGTKLWITGADASRWGVVFARTDREAGRSGITCFIVETDMPGITISPIPVIRPLSPCEVTFEDTPVPAENLLGNEGEGFKVAESWLVHGRVPYAAGLHRRGAGRAEAGDRVRQGPRARSGARSPSARRSSGCSPTPRSSCAPRGC